MAQQFQMQQEAEPAEASGQAAAGECARLHPARARLGACLAKQPYTVWPQRSAADAMPSFPAPPPTKPPAEEDDGEEVDESGVEPKDIELVMTQGEEPGGGGGRGAGLRGRLDTQGGGVFGCCSYGAVRPVVCTGRPSEWLDKPRTAHATIIAADP
jgi:NACalpha-BTF3-like transcription factor